MKLDYSAGCVNFRDVADSLELLAGAPLIQQRRLFRGGEVDAVSDAASIDNPATILNLRRREDPQNFTVHYVHIAASNKVENYHTANRDVRRWLNEVVVFFAQPDVQFPVLVHCKSGKDRTGVVVAALLTIVGVERSLIVEEYLLSDGEVHLEWINSALDGFQNVDRYFKGIDLGIVKERLAFAPTTGAP